MHVYVFLLSFPWLTSCTISSIGLQSVLADSLLENVLRDITWRYFRQSRQLLVLTSSHVEHSLRYLPCPRFVYSVTGGRLPDSTAEDDGVLLFLKDDTDILEPIPRTWCTALFVVVLRENGQLQHVCRWFSSAEIYNVVVILGDLRMYTFWPYREHARCGDWTPTEVTQLREVCRFTGLAHLRRQLSSLASKSSGYPVSSWFSATLTSTNKQQLSADTVCEQDNLFPMKTRNMQGCPLRAMALDLAPNVIHDGQKRDGVEVRLVGAIARKMNFTLVYLPLPGGSHWGRVRADGGLEGMIGDIYHNRSDLGFGLVTHNLHALQLLDYTLSLGAECLAWGVPLGAGNNPPPWSMLTTEFSILTWMLIVLFLLISAAVCRILPDSKSFCSTRTVLWYVCSSLVAIPVPFQPRSWPLRVFVSTWLLYCIVINIAYQAELGSMVTVPPSAADINNIQELLDSGLRLYAPWKLRDQLVSSYETDVLSRRMVDKMLPGRNIQTFINRLQQQEPDVAYLLYRRTLEYYANQLGWKFHIVTSDCIIYTPTTMVLRRGSPLTYPINGLLGKLYTGGFLKHWFLLFTPRNRVKEKLNTGLTLKHLFAAFMLLKLGLVTAMLMLCVELHTSQKHQLINNK